MNADAVVRELAGRHGLAAVADRIVAALSPAVHLRKSAARGASLRSKLGGVPLLPADAAWPHRGGRLLTALAQIDCSEVTAGAPDLGLPGSGLLQFFYDAEQQPWGFDPADAGGAAVRYWPNPALCRAPAKIPAAIVPERPVTLHPITTLPSSGSIPADALDLTVEQGDAYFDLHSEFTVANLDEHPAHQLVGHPDQIQGDMQGECQLVSNGLSYDDESPRARALARGAVDWTLLLQVDSDDDLQLTWGDLGRIYFWIRRQDLHAGDFTRTWTVLQCS